MPNKTHSRTAARALPRPSVALSRAVLKKAPMLALFGLLAFLMRDRIAGLDTDSIRVALSQVGPGQWIAGLALTAVSFWSLGQYDGLAHRLIGRDTEAGRAARSGITAIALGQTLGLGAVTGALVRWRMLPELSLVDAGKISALVSVSFLAAWAVVTALAVIAFGTALPHLSLFAFVVLAGAVALAGASLWRPARLAHLPLPSLKAAGLLLAFTAIDTLAAGAVLWVMLPESTSIGLGALVTAYLLALGAGLVLTTPGGVGPFELALIALLPGTPAEPVLAAVLAYRAVYYAVPALLAGLVFIRGPLTTTPARASKGTLRAFGPGPLPFKIDAALATAPRAEAALLRHGRFALLTDARDRPLALAARSGQSLIALGDALPSNARPEALLDRLTEEARRHLRAPVLYKSSARLAARARARGWQTLRIAEEGWIDPRDFSETGSARRTLRRKLRKAEDAGVALAVSTPDDPLPLPIDEMDRLARSWAEARGGERGFSMGVWDPATLRDALIVLARDPDGTLVAFATFHLNHSEMTLDLMRQAETPPDGTMYLVLASAIATAKDMGLTRFSLAAVPARRADDDRSLSARLQARLDAATGAEGLRQFKSAFAPHWEPLYLAAPSRTALALAALDLSREITRQRPRPDDAPDLHPVLFRGTSGPIR